MIARAKGWGSLLGFAASGWAALGADLPTVDVALRALGGGVAGCLIAWTAGVTIWRQLLIAQLRAAEASLAERDAARARALEAATAAGEAA